MFCAFELTFFKFISVFVFFMYIGLLLKNKLLMTLYMVFSDSFKFTSFIYKVFFLLLILNLHSLTPSSFPMSSLLLGPMMGLYLWGLIYFGSFIHAFNSMVSHFLPVSTPSALYLFMVIIEFLSLISRPLALGIRLLANLTAGHILLHLFSSSVYSIFVLFLLFILELAVAMIQSYVFTMLLSLYSSEVS